MRASPEQRVGQLWPEARRVLECAENTEQRRTLVSAMQVLRKQAEPGFFVNWLAAVAGLVGIPFGLRVFGLHVEPLAFEWRSFAAGTLGYMITGIAVEAGVLWFRRRRLNNALRKHLNRIGIPVCLRCGYCLRGLQSSTCPECGHARHGPDDAPNHDE